MAQASSVTLSLHDTNSTPVIDLSTIINQWGTPSSTSSVFTIGGTGTDKIGGLNLINDLGFAITSLTVYAYGTVGSNSYTGNCANDSGSPFSSCAGPGLIAANSTISQATPISWTYSGGGSLPADLVNAFRLVDTSTGTGTNFFYEIEVNGQGPSSPTPEPSSAVCLGGGLLALGLFAGFRKRSIQ